MFFFCVSCRVVSTTPLAAHVSPFPASIGLKTSLPRTPMSCEESLVSGAHRLTGCLNPRPPSRWLLGHSWFLSTVSDNVTTSRIRDSEDSQPATWHASARNWRPWFWSSPDPWNTIPLVELLVSDESQLGFPRRPVSVVRTEMVSMQLDSWLL